MWRLAVLVVMSGCGFQIDAGVGGDDTRPDAPTEPAPPRLIPGGGIGDGAIAGVVNVYAVDELTRAPIAGTTVDVGGVTGLTGADGLFIASAPSLVGPQTVVVTRAGYRAAMWVGVSGTNVTIALKPAPMPTIPRANIAGTITGFGLMTLPVNHYKLAAVSFTDSDLAMTEENNLRTSGSMNLCGGTTCPFTVTSRTGTLALFAAIYDIDTRGTGNDNDDTSTLITWAYKTMVTVVDGMNQTGHALTMIPTNQHTTATVDYGAPPAALPVVFGVAGIELGSDGYAQLGLAASTVRVPELSVIPSSTYRFTAVAGDNQQDITAGAVSISLRRGLTSTSFAAGAWMTPPTIVAASRTTASWTGATGATIHSLDYRAGATEVLQIYTFDGSTTVTLPAAVMLPAGALQVDAGALRATFDVTSFGFDANASEIDGIASAALTTIN